MRKIIATIALAIALGACGGDSVEAERLACERDGGYVRTEAGEIVCEPLLETFDCTPEEFTSPTGTC